MKYMTETLTHTHTTYKIRKKPPLKKGSQKKSVLVLKVKFSNKSF